MDGDGSVGVADLLLILGLFGAACGTTVDISAADLNSDCIVDVADLLLNLGAYGHQCEAAGRR